MKNHKLSNIYARWIDENLQPNVYVVATLKNRVTIQNCRAAVSVRGTPDLYASAYNKFIRSLSKAVYGSTNWRRFKKLIPNVATLEGNGYGSANYEVKRKSISHLKLTQSVGKQVRYHFNFCFRKPDHMTFERFKELVNVLWAQSEWALPDIIIEERIGDCVAYSCKEGPETILADALSF